MAQRPKRLGFDIRVNSMVEKSFYYKRTFKQYKTWLTVFVVFPYLTVKTYNLLDRLPMWERRVLLLMTICCF